MKHESTSLSTFIRTTQDKFADVGIETATLDTRLLIAHALGLTRLDLLTQKDRVLTEEDIEKIAPLIERRLVHESVARILNCREFWGLPFQMNEATLEPRPDSETLIEAALRITPTPSKTLDLGTGTGCLLLALLHEWPETIGVGIDIAPRAIEQATANAERLGLSDRATFQQGNWLDGIKERFDLIISNPPYIRKDEILTLDNEVKNYDPLTALDGGEDGLTPYRLLIPQLKNFLTPQGTVLFEVGHTQGQAVET
ncbi:MAG: peptide chain release factor N(5)-glutamine methyltransferase, partial [Bdellovibrionales bacterium]